MCEEGECLLCNSVKIENGLHHLVSYNKLKLQNRDVVKTIEDKYKCRAIG